MTLIGPTGFEIAFWVDDLPLFPWFANRFVDFYGRGRFYVVKTIQNKALLPECLTRMPMSPTSTT